MDKNLIAEASTRVRASRAQVWDALVSPEAIKAYMFGATAESDWKVGSPIVWKGEWQGKPFEDKGVILKMDRERRLQYSHYSPLSGVDDTPENYHTVTIELSDAGEQTQLTLTQDKNASEKEKDESTANWNKMLEGLKQYVEGRET